MPDIAETFYSTHDFLKNVSHGGRARGQFTDDRERHGWYGIDTQDKRPAGEVMVSMIEQGWPEGAKLLDDLSGLESPKATNIRRRQTWSSEGDEINMQRVYSGQLDQAWTRMQKRRGRGPQRVRIVVDSLASASVLAKSMQWRGVAALKLADLLTEAGYSVQIESAFHSRRCTMDGSKRTLRVVIKSYQAPLDISDLAATTICAGFFRILGHEWAGDGMSVSDLSEMHVEDTTDNALLLVLPSSATYDRDTAEKWVKAQVAKIEVLQEVDRAN